MGPPSRALIMPCTRGLWHHDAPGTSLPYQVCCILSSFHAYSLRRSGAARTAITSGENMGGRVAVAGASGYAGGELLRIITGHPGLEAGPLAAAGSAGAPVTQAHPHLALLAGHAFEALDPGLLATADLVFLALPHEESAAVGTGLPAEVPVVDLSASFRLADPQAWWGYYRTSHAGQWCYGLPELPGARERIAGARRVAAPGCYATAAILALAPLLAAGLADPGDIVIVAASGTSGAGRSPSAPLLGTEVMGSMSAYQAGGTHRHTPELEQALRAAGAGAEVRG